MADPSSATSPSSTLMSASEDPLRATEVTRSRAKIVSYESHASSHFTHGSSRAACLTSGTARGADWEEHEFEPITWPPHLHDIDHNFETSTEKMDFFERSTRCGCSPDDERCCDGSGRCTMSRIEAVSQGSDIASYGAPDFSLKPAPWWSTADGRQDSPPQKRNFDSISTPVSDLSNDGPSDFPTTQDANSPLPKKRRTGITLFDDEHGLSTGIPDLGQIYMRDNVLDSLTSVDHHGHELSQEEIDQVLGEAVELLLTTESSDDKDGTQHEGVSEEPAGQHGLDVNVSSKPGSIVMNPDHFLNSNPSMSGGNQELQKLPEEVIDQVMMEYLEPFLANESNQVTDESGHKFAPESTDQDHMVLEAPTDLGSFAVNNLGDFATGAQECGAPGESAGQYPLKLDVYDDSWSIASALATFEPKTKETSHCKWRLVELDSFLWSQVEMADSSSSAAAWIPVYRAFCTKLQQLTMASGSDSEVLLRGLDGASQELRELTVSMVKAESQEQRRPKTWAKTNFIQLYMRQWLRDHWVHPYPNGVEAESLADICGVKKSIVQNWLSNTRSRHWRGIVKDVLEEDRPVDILLDDCVRVFDKLSLSEYTPEQEATWERARKEKLEEHTRLPIKRAQQERAQLKAIKKAERLRAKKQKEGKQD